MIRGIVFDMDGVLIDSHPVHKLAWVRFLASVGRTVKDQDLEFVLDGRKREDILTYFLGPLSASQLVEYGHRKEQFFREEALTVQPVAGLERFLGELSRRRLAMAVASSGSKSRVEFMLDRLSLRKHFLAVITGDDVRSGKPDPAIFEKAAAALGIPCDRTLAVEDAISGVIAAKRAGMKCLAIASNGRAAGLSAAGADRIVADFTGLTFEDIENIFAVAAQRSS